MRLKEEQVSRLAEKVMADLVAAELITLKTERGTALNAIRGAINADLKAEETLDRDTETLLTQTLQSMGSAAASIDRHKMFRMIKEKLAKERKVVL
jgi:hypothetical protein